MKKVITVIIALFMLVSLVSCNNQKNEEKTIISGESSFDNAGQENEQSNSDIISSEPQESETKNPQEKKNYDFVKEPFKNKDGIIEFSAPYGEVIENEKLRQELIPEVKKINEAKILLWGETTLISNEVVEATEDLNASYHSVLPELATTKEELVNYFKKSFTDNYISKMETPLEEQLFGAEYPMFKMINNKLCMLCCYIGDITGYYEKHLKILSVDGNKVQIVVVGHQHAVPDKSLCYMTLVYSEKYGWRLEEEKNERYSTSTALNYIYIKNADKINVILTGTDPILKNEGKVIIERNGVKYEKIEKFMSVKEMKDYFKEIFTEELAQTYIKKFIDVYYEENDCIYRKVDQPKFIMNNKYKEDDFEGYFWVSSQEGICWIYGNTEEIKLECVLAEGEEPFMEKFTSMKIAEELKLIKVKG